MSGNNSTGHVYYGEKVAQHLRYEAALATANRLKWQRLSLEEKFQYLLRRHPKAEALMYAGVVVALAMLFGIELLVVSLPWLT